MKHCKIKYIRILLMCIVVCCTGTGNTEELIGIIVKEYTQIEGETIYLRDIAQITAPDEITERIGAVKITSSPKPGKGKKFPGHSVESKIKSKMSGYKNSLNIVIPKFVMVERASQKLSDYSLKEFFYDHVDEQHQGKEYTISGFKIKGNKELPLGKLTLTADDRRSRKGAGGRISSAVNVTVEGRSVGRIYLSGHVDVFENVVCAKRVIKNGDTIGRGDLCFKRKNISTTPPDIILAMGDVVGKVARLRIRLGGAIRERMLEMPAIVEKGAIVKLVARSGSLTVVTIGVSGSSGRKGDQIMVENMSSKKKVVGRVVKQDTVEVLF